MLPLPKINGRERKVPVVERANAGLVWDKFVDGWAFSESKYGLHEKKGDWIKRFCGKDTLAARQGELRRACERLQKLAESRVTTLLKRPPEAGEKPKIYASTARFVTGLGQTHPVENGFRWHHGLGVPYIPASGVKGMIRAWAEHWGAADEVEIKRLFGTNEAMGRLIVFDALPVEPPKLVREVLTPHDGGWRLGGPAEKELKDAADKKVEAWLSPGDWHDPKPVPFLAVDIGARFQFALAPANAEAAGDLKLGYELLHEALGMIGAGAKTASGFGYFEPSGTTLAQALQRQIKPGDVMKVAENCAKKKWAGAVITVTKEFPNNLFGVVRGTEWNGKVSAQDSINRADLEWLDDD